MEKPVKGFEGLYTVNEFGEVRNSKGDIKFPYISNCGYYSYCLYKKGKCHHYSGHRIVADAFLENKQHKKTVNHKNGNKKDNRLANLEWSTHSENVKHAFSNGMINKKNIGKYKHKGKEIKILNIETKEIKIYKSITDAAKEIKIAFSTISMVLNKRGKFSKNCIYSLIF